MRRVTQLVLAGSIAVLLVGCTKTASFDGEITDTSKGWIPNADVVITGGKQPVHAKTDTWGKFKVVVPYGPFTKNLTLTVQQKGFKGIERQLSAGEQPVTLHLSMSESDEAIAAEKFAADYWRFETSGGSLSDAGWKRYSKFYGTDLPLPKQRRLFLIYKDYAVWPHPEISGNIAKVTIGYGPAGEIDQLLRYDLGSMEMKEEVLLVLTRDNPSGPWRVKDKPIEPAATWLTSEAAVEYLKHMRTQAPTAELRQNAAETLAMLQLPPASGAASACEPGLPTGLLAMIRKQHARYGRQQAAAAATPHPCGA